MHMNLTFMHGETNKKNMETRFNEVLIDCDNLLHPNDAEIRKKREEQIPKRIEKGHRIIHKKKTIKEETMPIKHLNSVNNPQNASLYTKKLSKSLLTLSKITEDEEDTEKENDASLTSQRGWRSCPNSPLPTRHAGEYAIYPNCTGYERKTSNIAQQLPQIIVS
ncbi:uncharacterized protein [Antedon mediterranea]|uniref:uncharacterized protein n=1 Tax=Antedon mediterranea TaxID=105859 RepID=UPI003AF836E4